MATYNKQKKYINYQKGNLVLAFSDKRWSLAEILNNDNSGFSVRLMNSNQTKHCDLKGLLPINLSSYFLSLMGFKDYQTENSRWISNGLIDLIDISQQLEGLYGPVDIEIGEDEDEEIEPDEPDPNQLMIENLVIYEPVNQPEWIDLTQYLTYNILFDYDGDWAKMRADNDAAREKRIRANGPDPYEDLEGYEDIIISTHTGYQVLQSESKDVVYDSLVYNEQTSILEGLEYLHELQNLYADQFNGENLFLEDLIKFKIGSERSRNGNEY